MGSDAVVEHGHMFKRKTAGARPGEKKRWSPLEVQVSPLLGTRWWSLQWDREVGRPGERKWLNTYNGLKRLNEIEEGSRVTPSLMGRWVVAFCTIHRDEELGGAVGNEDSSKAALSASFLSLRWTIQTPLGGACCPCLSKLSTLPTVLPHSKCSFSLLIFKLKYR